MQLSAEDFRQRADAMELRAVVADPGSGREHDACDLTGPLALVFGSVARGLGSGWLAWAAERVRIPMAPRVESLSVTAAAAVLLYEARRQRT